MAKNTVTLTFAGDDSSLSRVFAKLSGESEKTKSSFEKLQTGAKVLAGAFLGGLAVAAKAGFDRLESGQKIAAQTAAAIKSTGAAANVTASQVDDLATAIQNKSGVDKDAIASGENLLLTFTGIRNEAGKGNDIFTKATHTLVDMSTALGQDTKSSAIQLGKALNDPIKGITALQRVGVSFTKGQKDQIAALVKSGQTMKAQKVILGELNKEFGGSAQAAGKTLGGQLSILKLRFEDMAAKIVSAVLPAVEKLVGWVTQAFDWFSKHETITKVLIGVLSTLAIGVLAVNKAMAAGKAITSAITGLSKLFVTQTTIATTATEGETAAQEGLNTAMEANPIGLVVAAIALLATGFTLAWQKSETFRDIVKGAFNAVKTVALDIADFFTKDIPAAFEAVLSWLRGNWPAIATIISGPFAPLVALATNAFGIRSAITGAFSAIVSWIGDRIGDIVGFVTAIPGKIAKAVSGMWDALKAGLQPVVSAIEALLAPIIDTVNAISSAIHTIFGSSAAANRQESQVLAGIKAGHVTTGGGNLQTTVAKHHALGGVFTSPHLGLVAEAGPEAIIPLTRPGRAAAIMRQAGLTGGTAGGTTININVSSADPSQAGRFVVQALQQHVRRNGPIQGVRFA